MSQKSSLPQVTQFVSAALPSDMSLVETCGLTGQIVEQSDLALAESRIAKFSKMELVGQDSRRYLEILSRSMVLAIHSDV